MAKSYAYSNALEVSLQEFINAHPCLIVTFPQNLRKRLTSRECLLDNKIRPNEVQLLPVLDINRQNNKNIENKILWYEVISKVLNIKIRNRPLYIKIIDNEKTKIKIINKKEIISFTIPLIVYTLQGIFARSYCKPKVAALAVAQLYAETVAKLHPDEDIRSKANMLAQAISRYLKVGGEHTNNSLYSTDLNIHYNNDIFLILSNSLQKLAILEERIELLAKKCIQFKLYRTKQN